MANLILPRRFNQQPQYPVEIDKQILPGKTQFVLPSVPNQALGFNSGALTISNPNDPFSNVGRYGKAFGYRPNSTTQPGECYLWNTPNFDIGSNASAIGIFAPTTDAYPIFASYGGANWGLVFGLKNASGTQTAQALYVDSPTTASFKASIVLGTPVDGEYTVVGLVKNGSTISVYCKGQKASTTGGNGGIRRSAGSGFGYYQTINDFQALGAYGKTSLVLFTSTVLQDSQMFELLENPWQAFQPRKQVLYFDTAGGGATTGTGSLTTGATTASGTGTIYHPGTGSLTTGATTLSGTGTLTHTGTGALTTLAATLAGAGVVTHFGTGDLTIAAVTVAGEGTVTQAGTVTGIGALTISAITASGTGVIAHTGTGSLQTSVVTLEGAGVLTHTGTGDLTTGATTLAGEGSTLGTITGTGALTIGAAQVSGYDVIASVTGGGIGHGGFAKRRPRLIRIEEAENPEEVIAEIEAAVAESVKKPGRKPKTITVVEKPIVEPSIQPNQWIDYYEQQAQRTREQVKLNDLIAKAKLKIQQLQAEDTFRRIQEYEARMREEEELMLLLMAA